ncbi:TetR/AcrR family transcriptional regulator [Catenulispora sp. NF23]|uniref:TetR/AcrR family transcriptional regulator n=1 Tax=Catenulispora pinistramenti TaxID=2705254 RepID=UPI001BAA869C|nr:TetR/AcrR family transcriptional regulator [Catenulispora pinistramenti]MBS2539838.1 TetR/AcrR family transcriptional regulator [Catenulispora pinistramenti]
MTDSQAGAKAKPRGGGKRERLASAAAEVFHHQGVERTTLSDIAQAADVPLGNVYYYFKTKDQLVEAALGAHRDRLSGITGRLDRLPDPATRLKALIADWVEQREVAARYGCPFGTLAAELDKREDGLDQAAAGVLRGLIDWAEGQFRQLGRDDASDLAVELVAAYQGMSVLANALREPEVMTRQGRRLEEWIDTLARSGPAGA